MAYESEVHEARHLVTGVGVKGACGTMVATSFPHIVLVEYGCDVVEFVFHPDFTDYLTVSPYGLGEAHSGEMSEEIEVIRGCYLPDRFFYRFHVG